MLLLLSLFKFCYFTYKRERERERERELTRKIARGTHTRTHTCIHTHVHGLSLHHSSTIATTSSHHTNTTLHYLHITTSTAEQRGSGAEEIDTCTPHHDQENTDVLASRSVVCFGILLGLLFLSLLWILVFYLMFCD